MSIRTNQAASSRPHYADPTLATSIGKAGSSSCSKNGLSGNEQDDCRASSRTKDCDLCTYARRSLTHASQAIVTGFSDMQDLRIDTSTVILNSKEHVPVVNQLYAQTLSARVSTGIDYRLTRDAIDLVPGDRVHLFAFAVD